MPNYHKHEFKLNSKCLDIRDKFVELMRFTRSMASMNGTEFGGIFEARCIQGFPLFVVKVVYEDKCCELLIKRADLYIIGYRFDGKWYHFWDSDVMLDGSIRAFEYLAYENDLCSELGAHSLRYGVELMNYPDSKSRKKGCEIFYVHISESARFLPIQSLICQGFLRGGLVDFENPILSETVLFEWAEGTAEEIDVVCYVYASRKPDFFKFKEAFDFMGNLVRNWECLSKAWAMYCLLGTQDHFQTLDVNLSQCRIRNVHSLRNILGLLANQKLEELRTLIVDDPALDAAENHQRRVNLRAKIDSWTQDRNKNVVATKKVELSGKKSR